MLNKTERFLDPAYLASIGNFQLMAKCAVEGFLSGMHRSLYHGFGTEFLQYRNYTAGEDLKYLDWKVLAKSDKLYSKVFQEETSMNCHIIVDTSASMEYKGERAACGKLYYASMLAACIAHIAARQGDKVGLFAYSDKLQEVIPAGQRSGQLDRMLKTLTRLKAGGIGDHDKMLNRFLYQLKHRSMVVYISDMLEGEKTLPSLLKRFRIRHCDCIAIQVLDPDELDLPQTQVTRYLDSELKRDIITYPEAARRNYQGSMKQFLEELKTGFTNAQVDYLRLESTDSIARVLAHYLDRRRAGGC